MTEFTIEFSGSVGFDDTEVEPELAKKEVRQMVRNGELSLGLEVKYDN